MVDRIANLATSNQLMSYLAKTQNRLIDLQYQVTSEKVSPNYEGISKSAQYLLGLESSRDNIAGYMKNNEIMSVRLNINSTAMDGILTNISDFKSSLKTFDSQAGKTQQNIADIQQKAFNSLLSMQAYLNTSVGGRYIFAGGRTDTVPVDLNLTTLSAFQATYDGAAVTYPTTTAAHTENFSLNRDSTGKTNWLTFLQDGDGNAATAGVGTITSTSVGQFANVSAGTTIEITGTANNNGTYTVASVDGTGTTITVNTRMLTVEANNAAAVITKSDGTILNAANFTDLSFDRATDRITVGAASLGTNALTPLTVGSTFTVSGTAENNGTYTVAAVAANGDTVDIVPKQLTDEGTAATPTLNFAGNQAFTVNAGDDTISAAPGTYSSVKAGMSITIAGTASNNATFTVTSVATDGSSINVRETLTAEPAVASTAVISNADGTVASKKYYFGDDLKITHRVDENRSFDLDLNGLDPAFEKAIRAMAIIAQGAYGTEGGLDQNASRATDSVYLLSSAYDGTVTGTAPYGTETTGSVKDLLVTSGYQKVLISQTTESHKNYTGFLETQIANIENSDPLETITRLLDDQRALEASYQTLARIRELSLIKFM